MAPAALDLTQAKVFVSSPRISLRRAASYSHEKGSLASKSLCLNHLVFSPPPSPGLPHLLPRRRKPSSAARPSRLVRLLFVCVGSAALFYLVFSLWLDSASQRAGAGLLFSWPTALPSDHHHQSYELVTKDRLPRHATPAIASDRHGHALWTVSIPPNSHFPLASHEYVDICQKCREVAARVDALHRKSYSLDSISTTLSRGLSGLGGLSGLSGLGGFSPSGAGAVVDSSDHGHGGDGDGNRDRDTRQTRKKPMSTKHFIDVHEAEVAGYLTGSISISTLLSQQNEDTDLVGQPRAALASRPVCARSMTFLLASPDAGLGQTLLLLWMTYALAQSEGRPFFIDDTHWAYGKYTQMFAPPPLPDCRPPMRHEMLPCPREARHVVVTAETASEHFAPDGRGGVHSTKAAYYFDLARRGHDALFKLIQEDATHVADRVKQLTDQTLVKKGSSSGRGSIVGVHVRRGDRHPLEFQYRGSYIPLNVYADRAHRVFEARHNHKTAVGQVARSHSLMILASDDPTVYESGEFAGALRAQEFIRLAGKAKDSGSEKKVEGLSDSGMRKFEDETFGWEGGFFSAMFWNLGRPSIQNQGPGPVSAEAVAEAAVSPDTLRLRSLMGRAYMMDLAVLAGASDAIVCAVSSAGCRLLAVMMGRDAAESHGQWINVDGGYGWWAVDF